MAPAASQMGDDTGCYHRSAFIGPKHRSKRKASKWFIYLRSHGGAKTLKMDHICCTRMEAQRVRRWTMSAALSWRRKNLKMDHVVCALMEAQESEDGPNIKLYYASRRPRKRYLFQVLVRASPRTNSIGCDITKWMDEGAGSRM